MWEENAINKLQEYFWVLHAREMQQVLSQISTKGSIVLAKITSSLTLGIRKKVLSNVSKRSRADIQMDLNLIKDRLTPFMQEESCLFALEIVQKMIKNLEIRLPEVANSVSYYNGESLLLFKDEQISSRRLLESWIVTINPVLLVQVLASAKRDMGADYLETIQSLSQDFRKYLLSYLAKEDYEVIVSTFNKVKFDGMKPLYVTKIRRNFIKYFYEIPMDRVNFSERDMIYQGAVLSPQWWQARIEWERITNKLTDNELAGILLELSVEEVVLAYYESPFVYRKRLFALFNEEITGVLYQAYRNVKMESLGEEAYLVRLNLIASAKNFNKQHM